MAKKFTFRLESVLKLKTYKSSLAKEALNEVVRARIAKEDLKNNHEKQIEELIKHAKKHKTILTMQANFHHKLFLKEEIIKIEKEIQSILEIEHLKRMELNEAMKEEKVLTNLKDKKIEIHRLDMNREEDIVLNELAITRFNDPEKSNYMSV